MARVQARELDEATANAVALMTLYISATQADDTRAGKLLEELLDAPGGALTTLGGFETLCGVLLVLLELETGTTPDAVLERVGAMIAVAVCPPDAGPIQDCGELPARARGARGDR